jgi:hypothetical protein
MDDEIFYEYESSQYGDGVLLNEYRKEFALVAAKRKDGKVLMEWVFPKKKDGSKEPIDKSLPWKIKLGSKAEAIKVLKFFIEKLEGGASPPADTYGKNTPPDDTWGKSGPSNDTWGESGPSDDDIPF